MRVVRTLCVAFLGTISISLQAMPALGTCESDGGVITCNGSAFDVKIDEAANAAAILKYGTPTITGDSISFSPTTFEAEVETINTLVSDSATLTLTILPEVNFEIESLDVEQRGDYVLDVFGAPGLTASVEQAMDIMASVGPLDFTATAPTFSDSISAPTGTPTSGEWATFVSINNAVLATGTTTPWESTAGPIFLTIDATLTAEVSAGTGSGSAFIATKDAQLEAISINVSGQQIPLPAGIWMFVGGIGWLITRHRIGT